MPSASPEEAVVSDLILYREKIGDWIENLYPGSTEFKGILQESLERYQA